MILKIWIPIPSAKLSTYMRPAWRSGISPCRPISTESWIGGGSITGPYLRCLHGLGLCRWVLGDTQGAREVFERMLWLSQRDNQGVRFCLSAMADGKSYEELESR